MQARPFLQIPGNAAGVDDNDGGGGMGETYRMLNYTAAPTLMP